MKYAVVDTHVFSLLFRGQDADLYRRHLDGAVPVLSFVSVAELHHGATYANWGERRQQALEEAIRRYVIAPYDEELAKLWGTLETQAVRAGHPLGQNTQAATVGVARDYRLVFEREWRLPVDADPNRLIHEVLGFLVEALEIALAQDMPKARREIVYRTSQAVRELAAA